MRIQVNDVSLDAFIEDFLAYVQDHLNLVSAADGAVLCKHLLDIFGRRLSPRMFEKLRSEYTKQILRKN